MQECIGLELKRFEPFLWILGTNLEGQIMQSITEIKTQARGRGSMKSDPTLVLSVMLKVQERSSFTETTYIAKAVWHLDLLPSGIRCYKRVKGSMYHKRFMRELNFKRKNDLRLEHLARKLKAGPLHGRNWPFYVLLSSRFASHSLMIWILTITWAWWTFSISNFTRVVNMNLCLMRRSSWRVSSNPRPTSRMSSDTIGSLPKVTLWKRN